MRAVSLAIGLTVAALAASPVLALHNHLEKSTPAADETLAASPKEIRLWFAEKIDPKFSSITLMRPDSSKIEIGKAHGTDDPKSIAADVTTPLASGKYLIRWRTAGDDGHAVRGTFGFAVK